MYKLDRTSASRPTCLDHYHYPENSWDELTDDDKKQIRASLQQMQGNRCAYCEGRIYHGGHIEHFRRKNPKHFPQKTFAWDNLFLSCDSLDHCGHYKDRRDAPPYNPDDLIKPDVNDPDTFLYFHSSGEVLPRTSPNATETHRAEKTICVFNLNCGRLTAERRRTIRAYIAGEPGILDELMQWDQQLRQDYINQEIAANRNKPYATVIRHFFEKVS